VLITLFKKLFFITALLASLFAPAAAQTAARDASKVLPDQVGDFRARGPADTPPNFFRQARREDYGVKYDGRRSYTSAAGEGVVAYVVQADSESAAYSFFTFFNSSGAHDVKLGDIGTASVSTPSEVWFVKGSTFVLVGGHEVGLQSLTGFARQFAATLEGGENGAPSLALHLPDWEKRYGRARYAVTLPALQQIAGNRPALDAVPFEGGAEAVTSDYDGARLVVVEFNTPQHAFDADAAINARINELRAAGQPVPSSYKRVGNYAVFVFDAPDVAAADKLMAGVKYEKDVRWLGRNPHAEEIAVKAYTSKMGGVILTTLVTTGLAILLCLGVGGAIGGVIFLQRRSRQTAQQVYTDAGGMVRLNIEELNTPPAASNLLGRGDD
jgi:hypothetical protein